MNVVKRSKVAILCETMVLYAENGDPELVKLLDPNDPDHEGWVLDWHRAGKFVLKKETRLTGKEAERLWKD